MNVPVVLSNLETIKKYVSRYKVNSIIEGKAVIHKKNLILLDFNCLSFGNVYFPKIIFNSVKCKS